MSEKDTWNLANAPLTPHIRNAGRYTNFMLGDRFQGINASVMDHLSLYRFLLLHRNESAASLAPRVLNHGKPLFTAKELESILHILQSQSGSYFARWLTGARIGGAVTGPLSSLNDDPSRSKFWDKFVRRIGAPIASRIPPSWNGLLWYMFILYNLEQSDLLGPSISTLMDSITLSLPVLADLAQEVTEKLVALAPVPYASFVGEAIGMAIALVFVLFAVGLNVSRKHFGSAFKAALEGIPIFGDILAEGAQSFEIGAERFLINRGRWLKTVDRISPHAEDFLDYYIPDVVEKTGPAPSFNMERVKANVASYVARETGVTAALNKASAVMAVPGALASDFASKTLAAPGALASDFASKTLAAPSALASNIAKKTTFANLPFRKTLKGGGKRRKHNKTYKNRR
jgi:hypothetical protein